MVPDILAGELINTKINTRSQYMNDFIFRKLPIFGRKIVLK